jgi:hypothetical protein
MCLAALKIAADHGLILVDTKYEFGQDEETGKFDSSTYIHRIYLATGWPVPTNKRWPRDWNPTILIRSFCVCGFGNSVIPTRTKSCRKRLAIWFWNCREGMLGCTKWSPGRTLTLLVLGEKKPWPRRSAVSQNIPKSDPVRLS